MRRPSSVATMVAGKYGRPKSSLAPTTADTEDASREKK
jgi:hypothetical protein